MTSSEIVELRRTLGRLRQCVGGMRARYGDIAAVRRLVNDLERLDIDVTELGELDDAPGRGKRPGWDVRSWWCPRHPTTPGCGTTPTTKDSAATAAPDRPRAGPRERDRGGRLGFRSHHNDVERGEV